MQPHHWHDHNIKALQIVLDKRHLLLVNGSRATVNFHLPDGDWQDALEPDLPHNTQRRMTQPGICVLQTTT